MEPAPARAGEALSAAEERARLAEDGLATAEAGARRAEAARATAEERARRAEEALAAAEERARRAESTPARDAAADRLARALAAHDRPDALAGAMLAELAAATRADVAALHVRADPGDDPLRAVAVRALERPLGPEALAAGGGLARPADPRPVAVAYDHPVRAARADGMDVGVRHELRVPLLRGDTAVGALSLGRGGDAPFGAHERELAERLCRLAAVALSPPVVAALAALRPPERAAGERVDLVRLLRERVEAIRPRAAARGVELSLALESLPPGAADPVAVLPAIDELLAGAVGATAAGGRVHLELSPRAGRPALELSVVPAGGPEWPREPEGRPGGEGAA